MATFLHVLGAACAVSLGFFALAMSGARGQLQIARPYEKHAQLVGAWCSVALMFCALLAARWL